jgi:hypothetical protein
MPQQALELGEEVRVGLFPGPLVVLAPELGPGVAKRGQSLGRPQQSAHRAAGAARRLQAPQVAERAINRKRQRAGGRAAGIAE